MMELKISKEIYVEKYNSYYLTLEIDLGENIIFSLHDIYVFWKMDKLKIAFPNEKRSIIVAGEIKQIYHNYFSPSKEAFIKIYNFIEKKYDHKKERPKLKSLKDVNIFEN